MTSRKIYLVISFGEPPAPNVDTTVAAGAPESEPLPPALAAGQGGSYRCQAASRKTAGTSRVDGRARPFSVSAPMTWTVDARGSRAERRDEELVADLLARGADHGSPCRGSGRGDRSLPGWSSCRGGHGRDRHWDEGLRVSGVEVKTGSAPWRACQQRTENAGGLAVMVPAVARNASDRPGRKL